MQVIGIITYIIIINQPGIEPGDVNLVLNQKEHPVFTRKGADLLCKVKITLSEALCGFDRIIVKHMDGRGIHVKHPAGQVIKPGMVKRVPNEGMPIYKRSDDHGDLYVQFEIEFPDNNFAALDQIKSLQNILPKPKPNNEPTPEIVDECGLIPGDLESFGATAQSKNIYDEDDDSEEEGGGINCTQQQTLECIVIWFTTIKYIHENIHGSTIRLHLKKEFSFKILVRFKPIVVCFIVDSVEANCKRGP